MKTRIRNIILFLIMALLSIVLYYYLNQRFNFSIPCVFYKITGYYCPGCGITRCLFSLLKGNIYKAFMYNQLVFLLLPFLFFYAIYSGYIYIYNKENKIMKKIPNFIFIILLCIVIAFGIIRNIDYFSYLRP